MIFHFFASSSIALGIQMQEMSKLCYLPSNNTLIRESSSRRVRICEKISQVALAAFPMASFLTQRNWFWTKSCNIYLLFFLIVLSLLPFMFAFPSLFLFTLYSYRKSFFLYITNYMPFRFSICFSCTEHFFFFKTFLHTSSCCILKSQ